ncbi:hypothetical protein MSP8886_01311 [Marinomonas spartinae]|uniref:Uncharacterized protein n=1 Tax=Marinomonas spartinae TaxID=1792290 RepID=A0A1A8T9T0_9GAMM|nr:hypothetical protein [Marinomonas spartinae]SBS28776.1 hypothetical protein MSP8886_01311 [Marinomonas spartinae]
MLKLIKNFHRGFIGGPNFSIPAERVVLLGNKQLSITVPDNNMAVVPTPIAKNFPYDSKAWFKEHAQTYLQHEFVIIFTKNWMYLPVIPIGTSSEYGMLSCQPRIKRTNKIDVTDLNALSRFVTQEYKDFHNQPDGRNAEIRKEIEERMSRLKNVTDAELQKEIDESIEMVGRPPLPPAKLLTFNNKKWIFYQEGRTNHPSHINFYCLPLSSTSFLEIKFNYHVDRSDKYKKWSKHAEESERRIMESVTLTDIPEEQVNLLN